MSTLSFEHVGPPRESSGPPVPAPSNKHADYGLVHDPKRRAVVYVTAPDYHQIGVAHAYDGTAFAPISTKTYRLSSQHGPWSSVYDTARRAVVTWGFDYSTGPYGVVVDDDGALAVVIHESSVEQHTSMSQKAATIVVAVERPGEAPEEDAWDDLLGIVGYDPVRGVTVCLTQRGIYELDDTRWSRVADAPELPKEASGDRRRGGGVGAIWDVRASEVVFWIADGDEGKLVLGAWNGTRWRSIDTTGLPDELWSRWGKTGFAIGDHPEHGVVVYAGPEHGLFGLRANGGFAAIKGTTAGQAPPRAKGGQLVWDVTREVLVHGPCVSGAGDQNAFWELSATGWKRIGATTKKCLLDSLAPGKVRYARHRGVMHAVGLYANVLAWDDATGWRSVVDKQAGDKARDDGRVQAVVTAWDGALHAVMDNGGVIALAGDTWTRKAGPSKVWKDTMWPLLAFDAVRGVIVGWGSEKKKDGRRNDTYIFDGKDWTKVKTAKSKPEGLDDSSSDAFGLYWDAGAKQVARLGPGELAHFDGKDWVSKRLVNAKAIETWQRQLCPDPETSALHVVNIGQKAVVSISEGRVTAVGTFVSPMTDPHRDANLAFDQWWWDDHGRRFVVHADADADDSYAMTFA